MIIGDWEKGNWEIGVLATGTSLYYATGQTTNELIGIVDDVCDRASSILPIASLHTLKVIRS